MVGFYINFILTNAILDFFTFILVRKVFKLSAKTFEIFMFQFFGVAVSVVYLFCELALYQFLLFKILVSVLTCFLIADSYKFKSITSLIVFSSCLMFAIFGFGEFMILFWDAVILNLFKIKISQNLNFVVILCVILYFTAIYCVFSKESKKKTIDNFLWNVSFFINGKHIEVVGLLDSGNSLKDTKTRKPVIVISSKVLKKYFSDFEFEMMLKKSFCDYFLDCETASGSRFKMPVIDIGKVMINQNNFIKSFDCVLGVVNQKFYNKKYECLLHQDFI